MKLKNVAEIRFFPIFYLIPVNVYIISTTKKVLLMVLISFLVLVSYNNPYMYIYIYIYRERERGELNSTAILFIYICLLMFSDILST